MGMPAECNATVRDTPILTSAGRNDNHAKALGLPCSFTPLEGPVLRSRVEAYLVKAFALGTSSGLTKPVEGWIAKVVGEARTLTTRMPTAKRTMVKTLYERMHIQKVSHVKGDAAVEACDAEEGVASFEHTSSYNGATGVSHTRLDPLGWTKIRCRCSHPLRYLSAGVFHSSRGGSAIAGPREEGRASGYCVPHLSRLVSYPKSCSPCITSPTTPTIASVPHIYREVVMRRTVPVYSGFKNTHFSTASLQYTVTCCRGWYMKSI